jgi:hypothetical protein
MSSVDDFADYPKGQVAMGSGDLIDATNIQLSFKDGEKHVATLRQNPAGSTHGTRGVELTLNSAISHAGFERDWFGKYDKREVIEFRFKVPGLTFVVTGRLSEPEVTSDVEDVIKFKAKIVGRYSKAAV